MATILNGNTETSLTAGSPVRVTIRQVSGEVLLSPTLLFNLQSWKNRFEEWAVNLAARESGLRPTSPPALGGNATLSNQTLTVDAVTTISPMISAEELIRKIDKSLPLGADVTILDLAPTGATTQGTAAARQRAADDAARILPSIPGFSVTGISTVLVIVLIGAAIFAAGTGLQRARSAVS